MSLAFEYSDAFQAVQTESLTEFLIEIFIEKQYGNCYVVGF